MSYRIKVLLITAVSLIVSVLAAFYLFDLINHDSREQDVYRDSTESITILNSMIEHEFTTLIELTEMIAEHVVHEEELALSNEEFGSIPIEERSLLLESRNQEWMNSSSNDTELIQSVMGNHVAEYLVTITSDDMDIFGEIFITNKYGAVFASSNKLTTYAHAHKYWWEGSYNNGDVQIFLDDRGYDHSVDDYVLGVVYPLESDGEFLGIIKVNYRIEKTFYKHIIEASNILNYGEFTMMRDDGTFLISNDSNIINDEVSSILASINSKELVVTKSDLEEDELYFAIEPLNAVHHTYNVEIGGSYQSLDQRDGGNGVWYAVYLVMENDAFESVHETNRLFSIISIGIVSVGLVIAYLIATYVSKPLYTLSDSIDNVAKGDFTIRLHRRGSDEFSELFKKFSTMAHNLEKTTTSRDKLEEEVERRQELLKKLEEISRTDELTGIYNRRAFNEMFDKYISNADRHNTKVGIMILDIDDFKIVNDTHGHNIGDEVLVQLAQSVTNVLRASDVFARWGGEEFIIMIPNCDETTIHTVAEKVRTVVAKNEHEKAGSITISIGMTMSVKTDQNSLQKIVQRADNALYDAKETGKNKAILK